MNLILNKLKEIISRPISIFGKKISGKVLFTIISLLPFLTDVGIVLKLFHIISLSWWVIFIPLLPQIIVFGFLGWKMAKEMDNE